ncbi:MAG: hypothetical protein V1897_14160 [Pseudomonadota bacterium]
MDRIKFLSSALKAALAFLALGPTGKAEAQSDDSGFTMSGGSVLGAANGTQGA